MNYANSLDARVQRMLDRYRYKPGAVMRAYLRAGIMVQVLIEMPVIDANRQSAIETPRPYDWTSPEPFGYSPYMRIETLRPTKVVGAFRKTLHGNNVEHFENHGRDFEEWLLSELLGIEEHEVKEFLRYSSGQTVFDPHPELKKKANINA